MSAASHAPVSLTRRALPYAALLFLLVGAHGLLETARDGLFLVEQPITRLPWLYLAVTAGVLVLTPVQRRLWSGRLHVALPLTLAVAGAVTLGFWAFAAARSTVLGFYVWTALFSSLVFVQFWLTADEAFSVDEAKRAFGFIAAGGLLGAVSGTGAARIALDFTDPRTLLLISAGATVAGAVLALVAIKASCQGPEVQPEMTAARAIPGYVKRDPYLRLLAVLALLTAASATLIDYLFKAAVAGGIAPERIPRLVANVYLGQSALALVVELVLVGLLLRSSGVTRSLALLPLVVLAGTTGYAVGAGLVAMLILKTLDGGLRPSLYRVGTELLYLPIGPAERRVVKPSIDTLGQRGGQALASLLLLALPVVPERHQIAAATLCLALVSVAWVQATLVLRRRYLERFQRELGEGRVTAASIGRLDLASAEVLVAGLGSSSVREVLAALDVLAGSGRLGLVPALILYHPDPLVVRSALRLLSRSQRPDVDALLPFLLRNPDDQVRATAAERWAGGGHPPDALRVVLDDPSPKVRASALIALSAGPGGGDSLASLAAIAAGPDLQARRALAWAIGNAPRPDLLPVIETLFLSGDVETRRELLRAAPGLPTPPPEFVSQLILAPRRADPSSGSARRARQHRNAGPGRAGTAAPQPRHAVRPGPGAARVHRPSPGRTRDRPAPQPAGPGARRAGPLPLAPGAEPAPPNPSPVAPRPRGARVRARESSSGRCSGTECSASPRSTSASGGTRAARRPGPCSWTCCAIASDAASSAPSACSASSFRARGWSRSTWASARRIAVDGTRRARCCSSCSGHAGASRCWRCSTRRCSFPPSPPACSGLLRPPRASSPRCSTRAARWSGSSRPASPASRAGPAS